MIVGHTPLDIGGVSVCLFICISGIKLSVKSSKRGVDTRDARLARGKTGCPAKSKHCPATQKLTKPVGRNGAKLTVDYTDYAHIFWFRVGK